MTQKPEGQWVGRTGWALLTAAVLLAIATYAYTGNPLDAIAPGEDWRITSLLAGGTMLTLLLGALLVHDGPLNTAS